MTTEEFDYFFLGYPKFILREFMSLSIDNRTIKPIDAKYSHVLNYFLKIPGKTSNELHECYENQFKNLRITPKRKKKGPFSNSKSCWSFTEKLDGDFGLLEVESQQLMKGMKTKHIKHYRLSLSGIFYAILYPYNIIYDDLILSLLVNYKDNVLFTTFLYPFIKEQTLLKGEMDTAFYSLVVYYLRDVCNSIVESVAMFRKMNAEMLSEEHDPFIKQVFVWYKDPSDNHNNPNLISNIKNFLTNTWIGGDSPKVIPKVHDNIIEILDSTNSKIYSILILKDEKRAVIRQNGRELYNFSVKDEGAFLSIEAKTNKKNIDIVETPFYHKFRECLLVFLLKLKTQISSFHPSVVALNEDENYRKALRFLKKELNFNQ
jgi:hypothetical protein